MFSENFRLGVVRRIFPVQGTLCSQKDLPLIFFKLTLTLLFPAPKYTERVSCSVPTTSVPFGAHHLETFEMSADSPESSVVSKTTQIYVSSQLAIFATTWTLTSLVGGVALFWFRRKQPLLAKRSLYHVLAFAACTFLLLEVPYREYFGLNYVTCPAHFTVVYVLAAVLPALLALRYVELTAYHARQSEEFNVVFGSVGPIPTDSGSSRPSSMPVPGSFLDLVDRLLLRFRLQSKVSRIILLCTWISPWLVYYIYQVSRDSNRLRDIRETNCFYLLSDHAMFAVAVMCYSVLIAPLLARLWNAPDALGLRLELGLQVRRNFRR